MRGPSHFKALPDVLREQAARIPDQTFIHWRDRAVTYKEFDERTDALAAGLADLGVKPGDVVSQFLPNSLEFLEAWWAILKAGAVFGPINPANTTPEVAYVLDHSKAVALVTDARGAEVIAPERDGLEALKHVITIDEGGDLTLDSLAERGGTVPTPDRGGDDLVAILYTSGTTGKPKGAMLTHANVLANAAMAAELVPLGPGERVGMMLPLFHANAQIVTCVIPMTIGCEVVMWERFSASTFWETVDKFKPVTLSAVPTILAAVLNTPNAPSGDNSLRYIICGAAPLSRELLEAFQERFDIRILEGYGLTETTCVSSINPYYGERKAGSIGMAVRGQQMKIVDPDGKTVSDGELGEIIIKGPNVMPGYLNNPEANAESIRDGWLHTGDVGYVDSDGYFFIVDRSKDMIIRGGENIYPREIEEVLYEHPGILECAVIGIPDEVRGEEVLAVVSPKEGAELDADELKEWAAERLAKFKVPKQFEIRPELPKTATGKISKAPLREEFGHWAPAASGS
ncbi:MAG: long-chain acyl-CoA synthetase [Solirubrobacteraceae bacterium]|jgi:long-chain acyl-CoA synthetase|nr:long-chain acyl-CoA synthetase [Solirubrobacteraceae bacterium]